MHLSKESKILCFLTWLPMKASRLRFVHEKFNFTLEELLFLSKWINIHFLFNWNYNNEVNWQVSEKKTIEMTGSSLTLCSYFFTQLFYSTATGGCFWQLLLTDISCSCFAAVPTQLLYSAPYPTYVTHTIDRHCALSSWLLNTELFLFLLFFSISSVTI